MTRIRKILYPAMAMMMLYSCSPEYIPNMVNAPLFEKKGELEANIGIGISGIDPQAAYALTDRIGIMLNGSFANRNNTDSLNLHKHSFGEAAGGYYFPFSDAGRLEVFAGYGIGKVKGSYDFDFFLESADAIFHKIFLQPSIGASTTIFDGSFTPRLVFVSVVPNSVYENTPEQMLFLEPVITAKLGYKYVKFIAQLGFSFPVSGDNVFFDYQPFIMNMGFQFKIPLIKENGVPSQ